MHFLQIPHKELVTSDFFMVPKHDLLLLGKNIILQAFGNKVFREMNLKGMK